MIDESFRSFDFLSRLSFFIWKTTKRIKKKINKSPHEPTRQNRLQKSNSRVQIQWIRLGARCLTYSNSNLQQWPTYERCLYLCLLARIWDKQIFFYCLAIYILKKILKKPFCNLNQILLLKGTLVYSFQRQVGNIVMRYWKEYYCNKLNILKIALPANKKKNTHNRKIIIAISRRRSVRHTKLYKINVYTILKTITFL